MYLGVLLLPICFYLAISGKIKNLNLLGNSVEFREQLKALDDDVVTFGQFEAERRAYLGKLKQVSEKDAQPPTLIYADIDGLRKVTRSIFEQERKLGDRRRLERQIRNEIINRLAMCFTEAFYDAKIGDKHDLYALSEPDLIMMARATNLEQAEEIARNAQGLFSSAAAKDYAPVTTTVLIIRADPSLEAVEMDQEARTALEQAKNEGKGRIFVKSPFN